MYKKVFLQVLKFIILVFAISYVLNKINFEKLFSIFNEINIYLYLSSFIIFLSVLFGLKSFKWHKILQFLGHKIHWQYTYKYYVQNFFLNFVLPTSIGGDVGKSHLLKKYHSVSYTDSIFATICDRLSGLLVLLFLFLLSFLHFHTLFSFSKLVILILVFLLIFLGSIFFRKKIFNIFILLFPNHKIKNKLIKLYNSLNKIITDKKMLLFLLSISLTIHITGIAGNYLLFLSVAPSKIGILFFSFILITSRIIDSLPISFGGIGVRESIFIFLGELKDVDPETMVSYSLLIYTFPLILYLGFLILKVSKLAPSRKDNYRVG